MANYYIISGHPENVEHSVNDMINRITNKLINKPSNYMVWGFHEGWKKDYEERIKKDDEIFLYSTDPVKGIILYGIIVEKFIDDQKYWPINSKRGDNWPYRIYIEVKKISPSVKENPADYSKWKEVISYEELDKEGFMVRRSIEEIKDEKKVEVLKNKIQQLSWVSITPIEKVQQEETFAFLPLGDIVNMHLIAGKNIILVGAPGVGKTRLAKEICRKFNIEYEIATANAEWSTFDLIGGYVPSEKGIIFNIGLLTKAVLRSWKNLKDKKLPVWFIIDEINRCNIDLAFGKAFTLLDVEHRKDFSLLSEEELSKIDEEAILLSNRKNGLKVPYSFRIIATMNSYDRTLLFRLGFALMRRFAFIEIKSPFSSYEEKYNIEKIEFGKFKDYIDDDKMEECFNEAKSQLLMFSNGEYEDYCVISKENFDKIKGIIDQANFPEDFLKAMNLIVAISKYLTINGIIDIGYAQMVDALKFLIVFFSLKSKVPTINELLYALDEAISAYIFPQLDVLGSKIRMEELEIYGGKKELSEKINEFYKEIKNLNLNKSVTLIEKLKTEYRIF
jgi:hypothetical protein